MGRRLKNPKNLLLRRSIFFLALLSLLHSAKPFPSNSTLDPKQLRALRSIGLRAHSDPCSLNSTSCDSSSPFRHIVSLRLSDCSASGLRLSHSGLRALSPSLRSLSFLRCPIIPRLPFLPNLTSLSLVESALSGPLPPSIALLRSLRSLDLSSNSLSGPLPASIAAIPCLASLNLRFNRFNGSLPLFLSRMPCLTRLFLDGNRFSGVFPFDPPFIRSLRAFTLSGNTLLCYNRSLVPPKLLAGKGVAPCDHYGLPATPPPGGTAAVDIDGDDLSDYEDYDGSEEDAKKKGGPSGAVLGVAIALSCLVFLVIFLACLSKLCR